MTSFPQARAAGAIAVVVGLLATGSMLAFDPVRDALRLVLSGDLDGLRDAARDMGAGAALVLVGLALVHAVIPYPAELPTAAAGFAFGFSIGFPLMLAAWVASGVLAYGVARVAGRPVLLRVLGERRIVRTEAFLERAGAGGLLAVRLVPVIPFSLVCFVCGATRVPLGRFAWTTALGTMPLTALIVLLGARLQTPSATDPLLWAGAAGLLALLALVRPVGRRLRAAPAVPPS